MRMLWALLIAGVLAGCGVDGAPVPPGSDQDPNIITDPDDFDIDNFFL